MAGPIRISVLANASQAKTEINEVGETAEKSTNRAKSALKGLAAGFVAFEAFDKVKDVLKDSIEEAREAQKANAQTAAVIKSTGGTANVSAKHVKEYADSLGRMSGQNADSIQSGQNLLLTFQNVRNEVGKGNDVFDRATKTALNMATALGTAPKAAAKTLGKALNDPIKGLTALTRVGVTFTAQQTAQIQKMAASGHVLQAQKIILGQLDQKFDGSAKAQATAGGKLKETFRQIEVEIGDKLLPILDKVENYVAEQLPEWMAKGQVGVDKVKAAFDRVEPSIDKVIGFLRDHQDTVKLFAKVLGTLTVAAIVATTVWTALDFALTANPIGIIIVALAALVTGLIEAYKHSATFRAIVDAAFAAVKVAVQAMVTVAKAEFSAFIAVIKVVGGWAKWLWNNAFEPALKFIIDGIAAVIGAWAKLVHSIASVPFATKLIPGLKAADDALQAAARGAAALASNINKIPNSKSVSVVLNVVEGVVHTTGGHVPGDDPRQPVNPRTLLPPGTRSTAPSRTYNISVAPTVTASGYDVGEAVVGAIRDFEAGGGVA